MNDKERLKASLDMERTDRPSVTCTGNITIDAIKKSGVNPSTIWHDGNAMAHLAMTSHEMCGTDEVSLFFVWTHLEALGAVVNYEVKGIPYLQSSPFKLFGEYEMPDMDKYVKSRSVQRTVEGYKKAKQLAGKDTPVTMVTSWGPLTTAGHLVGTEALMLAIATDPDEVKRLLKFVCEFDAEAYKAELAAGFIDNADWIKIGEPSASGDLISPEMFEELSLPYLQKEINAIKSNGQTPVLHICGDTTNHIPYMVQSGAKALNIEEKVDPYVAMRQVNGKVALIGNVGPVKPLMMGTPEQVKADTLRCIDAGFQIINPGCAIAPETPTANLKMMCDTVKAYKR
jgi:[methyl-Co(III) methanol-specific corrinoid protein]:coenzyme M methyltransferase